MKYTVKYKKGLFWKTLTNVVGDGYVEGKDVRFFILEDGRVVEIPVTETTFIFSKERKVANEKQKT